MEVSMAKNPFNGILKMYKKQVKENDKLGYADDFKNCAEVFFEKVNEEYDMEENPVHFEDIDYLDGYFLFGHGTNSVVHFHIKECPGWLFGIWWSMPDNKNKEKRYIDGEIFAQYEETIDKFKPSRSEIRSKISVFPNKEYGYCDCYSAANMINFIRTEPYLAFCRDYNGWDYNEEYHTREEAKREYDNYRGWQDNANKYTKECDDKVLAFVKERVLPSFSGAEIEDLGDDCSPRYEVIAPLKKNKDLVKECGCYRWFDDDDEEGKKIIEEFNAIVKECKDISDKYSFPWFSPFNTTITFYK